MTATSFAKANKLLIEGKLEEAMLLTQRSAIATYKKAIAENPQFAWSHHNLGEASIKAGRIDEAAAAFRQALAINPNSAWSLHKLGVVLNKLGQYEEAVGYLRQAVQKITNVPEFYLSLATALVQLGEWSEAEECLYQVVQFSSDSLPLNEEAKKVHGVSVMTFYVSEAYFYLGEAKSGQQQWLEAVEFYRHSWETNPGKVECCIGWAKALSKLGRWEEVVELYRQAVVLSGESGEVLFSLGQTLGQLGRWEEVVVEYERAISLGFAGAKMRHHLGYAFGQLGRWEKAIVEYRLVVEINPKSAVIRHQLGYALMQLQHWGEAEVELRKSVELYPGSAVVWQQLEDVLRELGKNEEAKEIYKQAKLLPQFSQINQNAEYFFDLAQQKAAKKSWSEAIELYQEAVRLNPQSANFHHHLAYGLTQVEKWDEAIACYQTVIELNPNSSLIYQRLADALVNRAHTHEQTELSKSDIDRAVIYYCKAIELNPEDINLLYKVIDIKKNNQLNYNTPNKALSFYQESQEAAQDGNYLDAVVKLKQAFQNNPKFDYDWCQDYLGGSINDYGYLGKGCSVSAIPTQKLWHPVTVVVPIFNAYEDTKQCLESLLQHTKGASILLIDDASQDERVTELAQQLSEEYFYVSFAKNYENKGFVKTCNMAFKLTGESDIVLLNSDTIVTANWLEKMQMAGYSNNRIASVTPLTNNGEICSVPNWLEVNQIPTGQTLESWADLIEKISWRAYPKIPTAVGFCKYMKRQALDEVGGFDEENFGKGYGEENDWSCRAIQEGYYHIIDDSTFIYHAGGKSFGEDKKQELILANFKSLERLHPNYFKTVHHFVKNKPYQEIISNIQLHLKLDNIRKLSPICLILHNSIEKTVNSHLGGTEYHCAALVSAIKQDRPVYCLFYKHEGNGSFCLTIFFREEKLEFEFPLPNKWSISYTSNSYRFNKMFMGIIDFFQPSLIHLHHLINLPILDVVDVFKKLKIPYILSCHDYYWICPSYNLVDKNQEFCYEKKTEKYCSKCVDSLFKQGENLKREWYQVCRELMEKATTIVTPSETARSYFIREYPGLEDKLKAIPHGILPEELLEKQLSYRSQRVFRRNSQVLKVGFVGGIRVNKGLNLIINLLQTVQSQKNLRDLFEFTIYGATENPIPNDIQNLKQMGRYQKEDLPQLLEFIDVVMFPVIWPETYCLVADEVLALGIPIITTPLGAIAERVKKFDVGWVSDSVSVAGILTVLTDLVKNPEELLRVQQNVQNHPLLSYENMVEKYLQEYEKCQAEVEKSAQCFSHGSLNLQSIFYAFLQAKWSED